MADPYALVDPNAMEAPEVPEVGINVPSFQPPDEETLAEMVNPPGSKDSGDIPASPPPAAAPAPAATPPPPAAAPAAAPADDGAAKKKAEEEAAAAAAAKKKAEEAAAAAKKKADDEAAAKKKADDAAAAKKKEAEEEAKKKAAAEDDKKKLDSAAAKAKEEADAKKKAEEEKLKAAAAAEAASKKASEAQSNEAEKKKAEEAAAKLAAEEKAKAEADAAAKKAKEEADAKAAAEAAAAAAPTPPPPAAPAASPKLDAPAPLPTAAAPLPASPAVAATQPAAQALAPQQYPFPASPMMPIQYYPPSYSAANEDLAKERAKEMETALRADLLKAEQKLEDNNRTAREDMRRFESQIELLKDDLRKERDQRLASQAAAEAAAMKQSHDRQLESIADKFSKSLEQQHAVQLEKNAELEKKLLAKDSDLARRLEQMQSAKPATPATAAAAAAVAPAAAPSREALLADLKRDLLSSGHIKKLEEETESVRRECEEKLKAEREELGLRVTLLHHRMDLQHKQDIVEMLRREQAEREWEENLETDGFVDLRKSERRGRKELAVNERRRDTQTKYPAVAVAAGQRGVAVMPPSLADKALMSLMQKATPQTASNTVYTTKSFQKVFKVLEGCDLVHYAPVFAANEFDIQCLAGITDADLDAMGISTLGARKRLLAEAEKLRMGMMANPEEPEGQVVGGRALVDDEVTSQWCQERMAARNRASYPDVFAEVLWDDAWREATRLDASGAPCAAPGGHKGELLLQRLSGAPPPGAAFARQPRSPTPAPPAPLDTWQTYTTDQGIPYYHNAVTGETLWHPPQ